VRSACLAPGRPGSLGFYPCRRVRVFRGLARALAFATSVPSHPVWENAEMNDRDFGGRAAA
jgi:hypothetical protein